MPRLKPAVVGSRPSFARPGVALASALLVVLVVLTTACTQGDAGDAGFYAEVSTRVEDDARPPRWQIAVGSREATETRLRWWQVDGDHWRREIEYLDPPLEAGTVTTVADGDEVWTYDSRTDTYQRLPPIPEELRMFPTPAGFSTLIGPANASSVEELADWYRETGAEVTLRDDEQSGIRVIEYRPVWRSGSAATATAPSRGDDGEAVEPVGTATPRPGGSAAGTATPSSPEHTAGGVGRIWVDTNLMFVMRHEIDGGEGHQSALFEVTTLDHGIAIDGDLLRFEPPPGARKVESMTAAECGGSSGPLGGPGFSAPAGFLRPSYAPEGFLGGSAGAQSGPGCELVGAWSLLSATGGAGYALLQQRVRVDVPDALRAGEPVDVSGQDGYHHAEGGVERLAWREGELVAMLESDTLPFEELRRIAESAERVTADTPPFTPTPVATATPAPTSSPESRDRLPGDMQAAIGAALAHDGAQLAALLTTTEGPCVVDPAPGILVPPACPSGVEAGTLVDALVFGGCPDQASFIDPAITYRVKSFDASMFLDHLIGVVDLGVDAPRYAALFGFEKAGWLGFDEEGRLIGAGGGGDCAAFDLQPRLADAPWLSGPDWGE